jgi:hypothetical protein
MPINPKDTSQPVDLAKKLTAIEPSRHPFSGNATLIISLHISGQRLGKILSMVIAAAARAATLPSAVR